MDKRQSKRFKTRQLAKIGEKLGVVNDISDEGIGISLSSLPQKRKVAVSLETDDEKINVTGVIQWVRRKRTWNSMNRIGIHLLNPPPAYAHLVTRLTH